MTTAKSRLTGAQMDALERIQRLQARREKRFEEDTARGIYDGMGVTSLSPWIFMSELTGIRHATIKALVNKGRLESRPGDGWGTEYKLIK